MSPVLIATIAGIVTALCWGTSDYLSARAAKRFSPFQVNFGIGVIGMIMLLPVGLAAGLHIDNAEQLVRILINVTCITIAFTLMVKALSTGAVGIIVPLANSYPLVTVGLSIIFATTAFTAPQFMAMAGIVLGAAALAYEKNHKKIPIRELHKDTLLAAIAAAVWGIGFFVVDPAVRALPWQTVVVTGQIFSVVIAIVIMAAVYRRQSGARMAETLKSRLILVTSLVGISGAMALYFGADKGGSLIIPVVLSSAGPLVAALWGAIFDHERLGALKRAGALLVVAGIVVLNLA